ncbi:MAG: sulfurtransferase [Acidobacteriota bacterium]|nr:sulfurtransferase [Acidobacteriota bacterium]
MHDLQIDPQEVKQKIDRGEEFVLLDVRERWEHEICRIDGSVLVPMNELPARAASLEEAAEVVVYCHSGIRSLNAAAWLRAQGIESARSMAGGIDRWSREIDSAVPRY